MENESIKEYVRLQGVVTEVGYELFATIPIHKKKGSIYGSEKDQIKAPTKRKKGAVGAEPSRPWLDNKLTKGCHG